MTQFKTLISATELSQVIADPEIRVVDCRFNLMQPDSGRADYLSGHIPAAVYAHLDEDLAGPVRADTGRHPLPDVDQFARTLAGWGISNASQVVAYDESGGAIAARLWWMLRWLGHENVAVLNGGFGAWRKIDGEIETGLAEAVPTQFSVRPDPSMVLTTGELAAHRDSIQLVDARDRQRFLGRIEPIDPVAGHVPGALNLPFSECLDPGGLLKSPAELLSLWQNVLNKPSESRWAVMCGSGVTACHLALSAAEAGILAPRLYVGSWSEWIRDPARPIATEPT